MIRRIVQVADRFFYERVSATGLGLMRSAWAAVALAFLLGSAQDVVRYYSNDGILPQSLGYLVFRSEYRFTLLDTFVDPLPVVLLWCAYALTLSCVVLGIFTRPMTIAAVLLMFSFHERNLQPLGGGDTLLRNFGIILMIAPEIDAFSIDRLERQWKRWKEKRSFLPPLTVPVWPYRMILWQFIVIYFMSGWDKLQGTMWLDGTSIAAIFHHLHFFRWPKALSDLLTVFSPYVCFVFLVFEMSWLLLLVPKQLWDGRPKFLREKSLKRLIIAMGTFFHGGILVLMDVGTFSFVIFTGYLGLLLDDDFRAIRRTMNKRWNRKTKNGNIAVLYDGACRLCRRSMFFLLVLDHLKRLKAVDFRDASARKQAASDIDLQALDRALHIRFPDGTTLQGFDAFRALTWHLPVLRITTPFLYLPGVRPIGQKVYAKIAASRDRCANGVCVHKK